MKYTIKNTLFVKWFIVTAATLSSIYLTWINGFVNLVIENDISRLSIVITLLYMVFTFLSGMLSFKLDKFGSSNYKQKLHLLYFLMDKFFTLGLLGTIIGFCYMMYGTLNVGVDVSQIILQLKTGVSTALYTTLIGIVCSLLAQLQIFLIEHHLKYE